MKKFLQKLDALGLLLLVIAVIWYSVSNIWGAWNLGLAIAGGAMVLTVSNASAHDISHPPNRFDYPIRPEQAGWAVGSSTIS